MRSTMYFGLCLMAMLTGSAVAMYSSNSPVVTLTDKNFKNEVLQSDAVWLVEFYAPWCGHCKSLQPEWEKAAKALKGVVNVGAVDATAHEKLGSKYKVQGFPTIKVFGAKKRSPSDYQGGRTADAIVGEGMKQAQAMVNKRMGKSGGSSSGSRSSGSGGNRGGKKAGSEVVTLTTSNFDSQVLGSKDMWMVEFYAPWCGHCKALAPEWEQAARKLKGDVKLGAVDCTQEEGLAQRYGIKGFPTIKYFGYGVKAGDRSAQAYNGERKAGGIIDFAMAELAKADIEPEVDQLLNGGMVKERCAGNTICVLAVLPDIRDGGKSAREGYIKTVKGLAKDNRRNPFAVLWVAGGEQPQMESALELNFGFPALVAVHTGKLRYSVHRGAFTVKKMNSFLSGIMTGRTRTLPLDALPTIATVPAWDGKDAAPEFEEEFSLADLMDDDE